jgi:iron complex outermembrane recepter protein
MFVRRLLLAGSALCAFTAAAPSAFAQAASEAPTTRRVETIVVTAQKREEDLQDVPLAVSAVSGDTLAQQGIRSVQDLRFVAPSVSYGSSVNTRGEGLQIRGVGTQIFGDGVEQSVGVVIDGVPMGRNGMGIRDMIDVDRVEVLRGPQGMLFGKNASAGLISITTRLPQLGERTLDLRASFATLNEQKLSATANVPFGEDAALRVTVSSNERDGYVRNITRNEDLNGFENFNIRARFLADVTPDIRVLVNADFANSNSTCCTWTARSAPANTPFGALNRAAGITPSPENLRNAAGARFYQDQDNWGLSTQVDWDLGWGVLTGIAAYSYWYAEDNNDPDILPINVLDRNSGDSTVDQTSYELRLTSPGGQALEWTVGLFALNMNNDGGNTQAGTLGLTLPPGATLGSTRRSVTVNESRAIFGQIGYTFFDKLKLIAGARYTDDELSVDYVNGQASGTIAPIPGRFNGRAVASRGETNFSWRLTAQYNFTPDIMAYVTAAEGYKGAAYDQAPVNSTIIFAEPEIPTTYEAGLRSTIFGGTTILNGALFQTTFKDFQAQVFDQTVFPSRFITANAGELQTQGLELEFLSEPIDGLTLSGNAAWIDGEYTDFKNVACFLGQPQLPFGTPRTSPRQCIAQTPGGNFVTTADGNPLTNSPELAWNLSAAYERPIGGLLASGRISYSWRDEVTFSAAGDPNLRQEAYGLLGAEIGIGDEAGVWKLRVFGRNLTDEKFVNGILGQPVLGAPGVYSQFPSSEARQIVGVSLDLKFGG